MSLTVIIPAYNAVSFVGRALSSVPEGPFQTVVVDDGSQDGTADEVLRSMPSVQLIRQQNAGVSAARNAGMMAAEGEYLVFLDADDRLAPGALEKLSAYLDEARPDIVIMRSFSAGVERYPWGGLFEEGVFLTKEAIVRQGYVRGSVCGCAFRKEYLTANALTFTEGVAMGEDLIFLSSALSAGGSVVFKDIHFYEVMERGDSASRFHDADFLRRYGNGLVAASERISNPALRTLACLSYILGITRVGNELGFGPRRTKEVGRIGEVLPLSMEGLKTDRAVVRLLNLSYPAVYYAKGLQERLKR